MKRAQGAVAMKVLRLSFVILVFAVLSACDISSCNQITNPAPPLPTPFPVPSATPLPVQTTGCNLVYSVRIAQGGASCQVGQGNRLTVGCVLDVTATPVGTDLEPLPISVHGPGVVWGGDGTVIAIDPRGDNPFNRRIRALSPGAWVATAENCGRVGELRGEVS